MANRATNALSACLLDWLGIGGLIAALSISSAASAQNFRLDSWMTDLGDRHLWDKPLNQIAMPGSHDSGTYRINQSPGWAGNDYVGAYRRQLSEGKGGIVGTLEQAMLSSLSDPQLKAALDEAQSSLWTTQTLSLREQLDMGVRYFDVRLTWDAQRGGWYFYHGSWVGAASAYYGPLSHTLDSELTPIAAWINAHPGEIVFLHLRKLNGGNQAQKLQLYQRLQSAFVDARGQSRIAAPAYVEVANRCETRKDGTGFHGASRYGELVGAGTNLVIIDEAGSYGLRAGAGIQPEQSVFWNTLRCYTDGVERSGNYTNAANFSAILDQVASDARTAHVGGDGQPRVPAVLVVNPVFPPADNLKYWAAVISERYLKRLPETVLAEIGRALPAVACPSGSRLELASGACFTCPAGFTRNLNPLIAETNAQACLTAPKEEQRSAQSAGAPSGLLGTDCPRGAVLNLAGGGCFICPAGFSKNVLQTDMRRPNACLRQVAGGSAAASRVGTAKRIGADRYYNPRYSFVEIGRQLNLALIGRLQQDWRRDQRVIDGINVVMVDNIAMAGEPGDARRDPAIVRAIVEFNLAKRAQPRKQ